MAESIAVVLEVHGDVWARSADGEMRLLQAGDSVELGETVVTAQNARVNLEFSDGDTAQLADGQSLPMSAEMLAENEPGAEEQAVTDPGVQEVLALLEGEGDILEGLEDPAAGTDGGDAGGGRTLVQVTRIVEQIDPLAFDFAGPVREPNEPIPGVTGAAAEADAAPAAPTEPVEPTLPGITVNLDDQNSESVTESLISGTTTNVEPGQTVSIEVTDGNNTVTTSAVVQPDGSYQVVEDLSSLADGELTATATVNDQAGNEATDTDTALLDSEAAATITIDVIAGDDVINEEESEGDITITGSVGGDAAEGDTVTLTVGGETYTGEVDGDNNYAIDVPGSQLTGFDQVDASVSGSDDAGNDFSASTSREYALNTIPDADPVLTTAEVYTGESVLPEGVSGSPLLFKEFSVNGTVDGNDPEPSPTLGGSDSETPVGELTFTLESAPDSGTLFIDVDGDGTYAPAQQGDEFSTNSTFYWLDDGSGSNTVNVDFSQAPEADSGISLYAYGYDGENDNTLLNYGNEGVGVTDGSADNIQQQVPNQLGYRDGQSQTLVMDFDGPAHGAEVSVNRLIKSEGEVGKVEAYLDGEQVGSWTFSGVDGATLDGEPVDFNIGGSSGSFTLPEGLAFDQLRFTATEYADGYQAGGSSTDSSEYFVDSISYQTFGPAEFTYSVSDGDGAESALATVAINAPATNTEIPDSFDTTAPNAPSVTIADGDEFITADEITEGGNVSVTIGLAETNAEAGDTLTVNGNDITLTEEQVDADEVVTELTAPDEGESLEVSATITDQAGNTSDEGSADALRDTEVATPTISIEAADANDDGIYNADELGEDDTVNATIAVAGSEVGDTLTYQVTGGAEQTAVLTQDDIDNGVTVAIEPGATITASLSDDAGNTSGEAAATALPADVLAGISVTLDDVDAASATNAPISGNTTDVEAGQAVSLAITDGTDTVNATATVDTDGSYGTTADLSGLDDGNLEVTATVSDQAGNDATATDTAALDTSGVAIESITWKIGGDADEVTEKVWDGGLGTDNFGVGDASDVSAGFIRANR
ncbi:retention module-containing protein, partial [candidate division GN15 bacterium]|nr:retention module-containing protein [candidate division GN15 bacterium]